LSFDRKQGDLLVVDEGERLTEVNIIERGKNYGWNVMEGSECASNPCPLTNGSPPLFTTSTTSSFVGGFIYRGSRFAELEGSYIFADSASGAVFASIAGTGTRATRRVLQLTKNPISAIGEDANGEIYIGTLSGELLTLVKPPTDSEHPLSR
jgi:glucose/arabinose dehydrogenase